MEAEEKFVLEIKVSTPGNNSVDQYTTQLVKDIIRLEGPYDEGYVEIPIDVFHAIVEWVNRKILKDCKTCGATK